VDLSGLDLRRANFSGANLSGANLSETFLQRTDLVAANLSGANLSRAKATRADFSGSNMRGAQMPNAVLHYADLSWTNLTGANLSPIWAEGAYFGNAQIADANLIGAYLRNSDFTNADLASAKTDASTICPDEQPGPCGVKSDADTVDEAQDGNEGGGPWIVRGCEIKPYTNCPGVNWSNIKLYIPLKAAAKRANLAHANLERGQLNNSRWPISINASFDDANLKNANLEHIRSSNLFDQDLGLRATFVRADLAGASFYHALLGTGANPIDFSYANLRGVSFVETTISHANFSNANLRGANFNRSKFFADGRFLNFSGADLSGATWVNGQKCREGSVGRCVLASGVIELDGNQGEGEQE
jgi:uncharacterized protein YjbI with pentapeptide repeats